jgi:Holliday junction resolvase RusA-like endonuclease
MNEISFIVYGEPVAQQRAGRRHFIGTGKDGKPRAMSQSYDPKKSAAFKDRVYDVAVDHKPEKPLEGALMLVIKAFKPIPKSMPKYKRTLAIAGEIKPVTKPDLDNYVKAIKDALRGVIWIDDCQVVTCHSHKLFGEIPRVEIMIKAV